MKICRFLIKLCILGAVLPLTGCEAAQSKHETALELSDARASDYEIGDVFSSFVDNGGLSVKVVMSDNSKVDIKSDAYTYEVTYKNDKTRSISPYSPFVNSGEYVVTVTKDKLPSASYDITVSPKSDKIVTKIEISDYKTTFYVGDTFSFGGTVTAHYSDGTSTNVTNKASFSGFDSSKSGTKTITVSYGTKKTTYQIEILDVPKILVESITLSATSKTLYVGETFTVTATVLPANASNKTLNWSSSISTYATVSNGVITAKSAGTTIITAKSTDGSNIEKSLSVTVSNKTVDVTGISLDQSTISVQKGKTLQLNATILPSNATDKAVIWSGSKNGISVSSDGLVSVSSTATVGAQATIVATSHGNTAKTASCVVTVSEEPIIEKDAWTIMIYMCGSTLEYDPEDDYYGPNVGLATEDIEEILKTSSIPSDVNIIIETGGAGGWSLNKKYTTTKTTISSSKLQRWEVVSKKDSDSNNKLKPISTLATNQMASQSSFQSFLEWGLTDYPAVNTGVVLWNHGGALGGVCYDSNDNENSLNTIEVAKATEAAIDNTNSDKMTFIGYDACLMGVADIATINADYYKYMVASQESEPGYGWDYSSWLNYLYSNKDNTTSKIEKILDKICSSFITANCDNGGCGQFDYDYYEYYYCYSTLSVFDLSKTNTLVSAFETYASSVKNVSGYFNNIKTAFKNAKNYVFGEGMYGVIDFVKFLEYMDKQFTSISSINVKNAISSLIISKHNCDEYSYTPCGVCAFAPIVTTSGYRLQCDEEDYTGDYATKFSTWQSMMLDNW